MTGTPLVEEEYSGSAAAIAFVNSLGADGWRERYAPLGPASPESFVFDPQGDVENRIVSSDPAVNLYGEPMTDTLVWDAWGESRQGEWTRARSDSQYTSNDRAGFEAQAGYQSEWDSNLAKKNWTGTKLLQYYRYQPYLLTQRYYDSSTGKFAFRDPIGDLL